MLWPAWVARTWYEPARPFLPPEQAAPPAEGRERFDLPDIADVLGKRVIETPLAGRVTVRAENAAAALEVISRWAVDPRWLVYLPPTMSPTETSKRHDLLEHPAEAFAYFRHAGVPRVVCEEKHMGSRAVVVVCRDASVAARRFAIADDGAGVVFTRTGRRFFDDRALEAELLDRVRAAMSGAGWWERFESDWFVLDCELMPWSAKAQELLRRQYAAVGAAGRAGLSESIGVLQRAEVAGRDVSQLLDRFRERAAGVAGMVQAYQQYCWPVSGIGDLKLAPFHLLASERAVHTDKDHTWHMQTLAELCRAGDGVLVETPYRVVDVTDAESERAATAWWEELTAAGGEGMVVKPLEFVVKSGRGLVQPAVKCRGREYLRIIYGPEYTRLENLERLRARAVGAKRGLALREFALGIEALQRFVRREPLHRVHESVFAVLALESELVDPRL